MNLIETIKKVAVEAVPVPKHIVARVIQTNPYQFQIEGNAKWIIPQSLVIFPQRLTKYTPVAQLTKVGMNVINILYIDGSLKVGDRVIMVSYEYDQKYIILDKVGDV